MFQKIYNSCFKCIVLKNVQIAPLLFSLLGAWYSENGLSRILRTSVYVRLFCIQMFDRSNLDNYWIDICKNYIKIFVRIR